MSKTSSSSRLSTGISKLDNIPFRGLPNSPVYRERDGSSTTSTSFTEQTISDGRQRNELCSNVAVSESKSSI
jgi:KaiC/GvpD/RAD55 family RecA-like ATPase